MALNRQLRTPSEPPLRRLAGPPKAGVAGSNPAGGTHLTSANAGLRTGLPIPYLLAHLRRAADSLAACALTAGLTCCRSVVAGRDSAVAAVIGRPCLQEV